MLGTVHSFAASDQTLSGRVLRDAFGPQLATTGSLPGPFGYVGALGYYHDPDLAMPLLSIRHYAPKRGLFISRDPVLAFDPYVYAMALPPLGVDPEGLCLLPSSFMKPESVLAMLRSQVSSWVQGMVDWLTREARAIAPWVPSLLTLPHLPRLLIDGATNAIIRAMHNWTHFLAMAYAHSCLMLGAGFQLDLGSLGGFAYASGRGLCFIPCLCRNWYCWTDWEASRRGSMGASSVGLGAFIDFGLTGLFGDLCLWPGGEPKPPDPLNIGYTVEFMHAHAPWGGAGMQSPTPGDWAWFGLGAGIGIGMGAGAVGGAPLVIGGGATHKWDCRYTGPFP